MTRRVAVIGQCEGQCEGHREGMGQRENPRLAWLLVHLEHAIIDRGFSVGSDAELALFDAHIPMDTHLPIDIDADFVLVVAELALEVVHRLRSLAGTAMGWREKAGYVALGAPRRFSSHFHIEARLARAFRRFVDEAVPLDDLRAVHDPACLGRVRLTETLLAAPAGRHLGRLPPNTVPGSQIREARADLDLVARRLLERLGLEQPPPRRSIPTALDKTLPWLERFLVPSDLDDPLDTDGFLLDPESPWSRQDAPRRPWIDFADASCVVVLGEPGSGKTRLAARAKGELIVVGGADSKADLRRQLDRLGNPAEVWLDGLDEWPNQPMALREVLAEWLGTAGLPRIRLTCRTAGWPAFGLEPLLRGHFPELVVLRLAALRRRDVEQAAAARIESDDRVEAFMRAIRENELAPLASIPQLLSGLLDDFAEGQTLRADRLAIWDRAARRLLSPRPGEQARPTLTTGQRVKIAGRFAWASLLTGRDALDLDDLVRIGACTLPEAREVLETALFDRGRFRHRGFAECLASRHAATLLARDVTRLLVTPVGDHQVVPPRLAGLAGWIAIRNAPMAQALADADPEVLLTNADGLEAAQRQDLLERLRKRGSFSIWALGARGHHLGEGLPEACVLDTAACRGCSRWPRRRARTPRRFDGARSGRSPSSGTRRSCTPCSTSRTCPRTCWARCSRPCGPTTSTRGRSSTGCPRATCRTAWIGSCGRPTSPIASTPRASRSPCGGRLAFIRAAPRSRHESSPATSSWRPGVRQTSLGSERPSLACCA